VRYIIYGAGAIGAAIGGSLFEAGREVVLIARGSHLDALRTTGLRLRDPDRTRVLPIKAAGSPSEVEWTSADAVILAMKTQDTLPALRALAASAPASTPVICAQNGVANERKALRFFENVYGLCVMLPAAHLQPGAVDVYSAPSPGSLDLGRYPAGTDAICETMGDDLKAAGFDVLVSDRVMRWKYVKLLLNLGNSLEAACGSASRRSELYRRAREEGVAVLTKAGIDYASDDEERERRTGTVSMRPIEGERREGGSSWQSLARGSGSIESDWLNGEIVLLGRLHGVPTPVNALLQRVANEMARNKEAPGSRDIAALERELAESAEPAT
jgi:2-dehydropantoate 2-reductase